MADRILSTDVGTIAIKFDLYQQEQYKCLLRIEEPIQTNVGASGEIYQKVDKILKSIKLNLGVLYKEYEIEKIGLSTAMHTIIPILDSSSNSMYIWSDNRANEGSEKEKRTNWGREIYKRTGTPIHPMNPFYKLLYFKEHQPKFYSEVIRWAD